MSEFSQALTRERMRFQRSRDHVADQCGVSWAVVKRWEDAEAVPSRQQFKRLAGMFRRLTTSPPPWDWAAEVVAANPEGLLGQQPAGIYIGIPPEDQVDLVEPEPMSFADGLRQIREDNRVSQEELAELLNLHGTAISAWECEQAVPVQSNLERLTTVLPELRVAFDLGKVRPPLSRDVPKPVGNSGLHQRADVGAAVLMATQSSDAEAAATRPAPTVIRPGSREWMSVYADADAEQAREIIAEPDLGHEWPLSVDDAAQLLGRARLQLAAARRDVQKLEDALAVARADIEAANTAVGVADGSLSDAIARSLERTS